MRKQFISASASRTLIIALLLLGCAWSVMAQDARIEGRVVEAATQLGIPEATIRILGTERTAQSDDDGRFVIEDLPDGILRLVVTKDGFQRHEERVILRPGQTRLLVFQLMPQVERLERVVEQPVRGTLPTSTWHADDDPLRLGLRSAQAAPGLGMVRRSYGVGSPNVRGLVGSQVGVYLDGVRVPMGGPLDSVSPFAYADPHALDRIVVVKGPHALTYGAGHLAAVFAEHPAIDLEKAFGGRFFSGVTTNTQAMDIGGMLSGADAGLGVQLGGSFRSGSDFTSGDGQSVPGDYQVGDVFAQMAYEVSPALRTDLSFAFQQQINVDVPGSLLRADEVGYQQFGIGFTYVPSDRTRLRTLSGRFYTNRMTQDLDNAGKPTAEADARRPIRDPMRIIIDSETALLGGHLRGTFALSDWLDLVGGGDIYRMKQAADERITSRRDGEFIAGAGVWNGITTTNFGLFGGGDITIADAVTISGVARLDMVRVSADSAGSGFLTTVFRNRVLDLSDLDRTELLLSLGGAIDVPLGEHSAVQFALSSAIRPADTHERYANRFQTVHASIPVEVVGRPDREPERASQADLWFRTNRERWSLDTGVFARLMSDFLAMRPSFAPQRLAISPDSVYRYSSDEGRMYGADLAARVAVTRHLTLSGWGQMLWGRSIPLDVPAYGIAPVLASLSARYATYEDHVWVELVLDAAAEQTRVNTQRGEPTSPGYAQVHVLGGTRLPYGLALAVGVQNVLDETVYSHLTAVDPFTQQRFADPGRTLLARLTWSF